MRRGRKTQAQLSLLINPSLPHLGDGDGQLWLQVLSELMEVHKVTRLDEPHSALGREGGRERGREGRKEGRGMILLYEVCHMTLYRQVYI